MHCPQLGARCSTVFNFAESRGWRGTSQIQGVSGGLLKSSPHEPPGLFPSADSPSKREAAPAGCCQRELQLHGEESGLEKDPARTVEFGQETNRAQEKQLQLSEGLFHSRRDNPLPFSSFFFSSRVYSWQSRLPWCQARQEPSLPAPSWSILAVPGQGRAAAGAQAQRQPDTCTSAPQSQTFPAHSTSARRMRQTARPWRYFAAIGTASPSPAFFFFLCPRQQ